MPIYHKTAKSWINPVTISKSNLTCTVPSTANTFYFKLIVVILNIVILAVTKYENHQLESSIYASKTQIILISNSINTSDYE